MKEQDDTEAGFTLAETLVAFTILSGAIIISFQIFAAGLRQHSAVEQRKSLMTIARTELDRLALTSTLKPGVIRGRSGKTNWVISITALAAGPDQQIVALQPFHVTFRATETEAGASSEPLLDTVILARLAAP